MAYTEDSLPTWLDVVRRARQEMGVAGVGPSTTLNQTGELKRVVDWCNTAYEQICKVQAWGWLYTVITATLNTGGQLYNPRTAWTTPAGWPVLVNEWDLMSFKLNSVSIVVTDQQWLTFWPWDKFQYTYFIHAPLTVRPYVFTIRPDGQIMFQTQMDVPYTLTTGLYQAKDLGTNPNYTPNPDVEVPLIPDEFRMLIVWEATKIYAGFESDQALLGHATTQARTLRMDMEDEWLQPEEPAAPLV